MAFPAQPCILPGFNCGFRLRDCLGAGHIPTITEATDLAHEWLMIMNWQNNAVIEKKMAAIAAVHRDLKDKAASLTAQSHF